MAVLREQAFGTDQTTNDPDCWAAQRSEGLTATSTEFEVARPVIIKKAQAKLLNRVLSNAESIEIEDMSDLEKATSIVEKLHKIERLEDGKSTENVDIQASGYTLREVMEQHHSDEVILEAETKEIEETE